MCISNRITTGVKCILPKKVTKRVGMFTMVYGTAVEQALLDQNHYSSKKTVCIFSCLKELQHKAHLPVESRLTDHCSSGNLVVKQILEVHKNVLMLRDNKASRTNIMAILQHYNIPAQKSNKKIGDQNELLLKHCHSFLSVPITFVPDCSIENYSEAPEQKKSTLPDKQLNEFVPVAFENDSMVNLVKTQENEAETPEN